MIYQFVVSFALGIFFEETFHLGWNVSILVILVSGIVFLFLRYRTHTSNVPQEEFFLNAPKIFLIVSIAFSLGVLRMSFSDHSPDPNLYKLVGQNIYFESTVSAEPDVRDASARYMVSVNQSSLGENFLEPQPVKCLASATGASTRNFSAEKYPCISEAAAEKNSKSKVLLVADRYPEFKYGDKIKVSGKLHLPKNFISGGGAEFDYISFLSKDKIHFLIYRPQIELIQGGEGNKIISYLYLLKNNFIEKISEVVPEPNSSLLGGLIFGAKESLGEKLLEDFRNVGLIHIVVLSGYNLTIIAVAVLYVTSYFGKRNFGFAVSVFVLALFSIMVGLGATVVRASIMALIAILAKYLGRPNDALRALFLAGLFMLLWNPSILFYDPSFQLSFMATFGLVLFSPFIELFISKQNFQKFITTKFGVREIVSSTLAVQIFLLPLLIKMSGTFSLISFVANLVILPIIPPVMFFGFVTGLFGFVPLLGSFLSWPFGAVSYLLTQMIIISTELFASVPFSMLQTGAIPFWMILVWYLGYGFLFFKLKNKFTLYQ